MENSKDKKSEVEEAAEYGSTSSHDKGSQETHPQAVYR